MRRLLRAVLAFDVLTTEFRNKALVLFCTAGLALVAMLGPTRAQVSPPSTSLAPNYSYNAVDSERRFTKLEEATATLAKAQADLTGAFKDLEKDYRGWFNSLVVAALGVETGLRKLTERAERRKTADPTSDD